MEFRMRLYVSHPLQVLIVLLVASLAPLTAEGQSAATDRANPSILTGRVTDERGDAVAGARISATAPNRPGVTATTDGEGRYRLELPAGDYEIRLAAEGFRAQTLRLTVSAEPSETARDFTLEIAALPDTLTVTPARVERRIDELPSSVSVLDNSDVSLSAAQTIDDLLRQIPGFSIFRRSSSLVANPTTQGVSLRGAGASGASRTLVLSDGLPLNDAFGGWVYWDRVPRRAIERIEVVRGGSSDLYGSDALSGVINVISRPASAPLLDLEVSYGNRETSDIGIFTGGVWRGWAATLSGEATRTDGYFIIAPENRGAADRPAASRHRLLSLRLERFWGGVGPADAAHSIFLRGSLFDEDRKNGTRLQFNDTATESLAAGYRGRTGDGSNWSFALFANQQRFHQSFTAVTAGRATENLTRLQAVPSRDAGFSLSWSRLAGSRHLLVAGADLRGVRGSSDEEVFVSGRATTFVSAGGRQRRLGFFIQDLVTLTSRLQLSASARYDEWRDSSAYSIERSLSTGVVSPTFFETRSADAFSPRLALLYQVSESFSLRAAGYRAFRAPTLNELYRAFRVGDTLTLGNPALRAERLTGGEAGFGWTFGDRVATRVTGYWTETVNPVSNFTLTVTPTLITRERRNLGRTRSRGIEVESDFRIARHWQMTAGYLYSDATFRRAPQDMRLEGLWIPQVPRHQFTLQTSYSNPRYVNAAIQFRASGRQFDDDRNQFALDSFALVDLFVSRELGGRVELFLAVQNLLDETYVVGRTPIQTIGAPRLARGGVRLRLGR